MLSPLKFEQSKLLLIDQRKLPHETAWVVCKNLEDVAVAIETMVVRGAPAIGCTAAYGMVLDALNKNQDLSWSYYKNDFESALIRLRSTRPTAVNLFNILNRFVKLTRAFNDDLLLDEISAAFEGLANQVFNQDLQTCKQIGKQGASLVQHKARVLTHCNAGSLATAGYGTAVGVIRSLREQGLLEHVYVDETRPYLQGSRLTAYEMQEAQIPYTLITDSTAAYLMQQGKVDLVVVGADRIAKNGDTANKIGTYSLAVNARHHGVPFYVAAPFTTFDLTINDGKQIPVELRADEEVSHFYGKPVAPLKTQVYNPSFDVTPHELITAIITEQGVVKPPFAENIGKMLS